MSWAALRFSWTYAGVMFGLFALMAIVLTAPLPNTKTYTHVAVVTDGMGWPGTGLEWKIENDTVWVFLK